MARSTSRILVVAVVVAALGGVAFVVAGRPRDTTTVVASRRDVVQSAVTSGRVVAPARIQIGVVVGGVVAEVKVADGQAVKAGDVLLRLDDRTEQAAVAQARASVAQARAHLLEVTELQRARAAANLASSESELVRAQAQLQRNQKLASQGASTTVDVENADSAVVLARSKRDVAAAEAKANAEGGSQVLLAQAQVQAAQASLQAAEARLSQTRVTALVDATVLHRDVEPGDAVFPGRALIVLARGSDDVGGRVEIVVEPDEKSLAVLKPGQAAACAADAFPDAPFAAVVKEIAPLVDAGRGTVEVRLSVAEPPAFLRTDMTVSVEVTTGTKENALVVPLESVRDLATKDPWVLVVDGGIAGKHSIKLGARGTDVIEVLDGLQDGAVVVNDPKLKPGAKVKAS